MKKYPCLTGRLKTYILAKTCCSICGPRKYVQQKTWNGLLFPWWSELPKAVGIDSNLLLVHKTHTQIYIYTHTHGGRVSPDNRALCKN